MENLVTVPMWVDPVEDGGYPVVLPQPQGVHGRQGDLLVGAGIPGHEARNVLSPVLDLAVQVMQLPVVER